MLRGLLCAALVALPNLATAQARTVTFHEDVVPVLQKNCQSCHRPGEAAPFSMLTYKDARPWAASMKRAVVSRKMPPWHADPSVGHFANDRRLSQQEIDTIARWADGGAPEGDPKKAPAPLTFLEGWNIGQPDKILEMPQAFSVPATGTIDYQWIVMPMGLDKDTWIEGVEVRPGDRSVVHHVIAFYRRPGSQWLVDAQPGIPTPKGSGFPPGDPNYRVDADITVDSDVRVLGFTPHMHLRGKSFEFRAVFPDGSREVLLRVPKYDFNWQLTYDLAQERVFPKGTKFEASATFDNSADNPFNPDPKAAVRFGDQTWDEMMVGFIDIAIKPDMDLAKLIKMPPRPTGAQ